MATQVPEFPKTIMLKGELSERHEEAYAAAALSPGHIISKNAVLPAGGQQCQVLKHPTAGGGDQFWVAKEDAYMGKTIVDSYVTGDLVFYHIPQPGDVLYCRVAAAAAAIAVNDPLTSDGAGCLKKATGADVVKCHALDAVDNHLGATEVFLRTEWV